LKYAIILRGPGPDVLIKYEAETEMRETPQKAGSDW
jgi:hypothetical protein